MKVNRVNVFDKFGGKCAYCGESITLKSMQIDHVIPKAYFYHRVLIQWKIPMFLTHLSAHDMDHIDNLFPTCRVCNSWKNTHDIEQFRIELGHQIDRMIKTSASYRIAKRYGLVEATGKQIQFYFETII